MEYSIKTILKELTALKGVSGHESEVVKRLFKEAQKHAGDIKVDNLGNITVHIPTEAKSMPKVVVFAHMDEIGMIVKAIEPTGFLRLEKVGGIHEQIMPGTKMVIRTSDGKDIYGIVGVRAHHVIPPEEKKRIPEIKELYLDIGAKSRQQVEEWGINIGNMVTYVPDWIEYGNDRVSCKSMDNRAANCVLLELIARFSKEVWTGPDLYIVFGVQEEFSVRGIMPAIRSIDPDICIGLDITVVYDTPDTLGMGEVKIGEGPAITYLHYNEGGTLAGQAHNEKLNAYLHKAAYKSGVPVQREVVVGVITETAFMNFEGSKGYITANISIPTRYTHTPVELLSLKDVEMLIELLDEALRNITDADEFRLVSAKELQLP